MPERTIPADVLERWVRDLLVGSGLRENAAATVAAALVAASRRGVDSHGVARVPIYAQRLRAGLVNGDPHPGVVQRHGATALVDADHGPGQVAGVYATDLSVELAREHGVGVVAVRRSTHYGSAGYYAMRAAAAGMIGISTTNSEPFVIPYGGVGHALGTNPIALAAPTADGIFDVDMATSQVAVNRIINAREEGRAIPEGWGVDEQGNATTDPGQVFAAVPLGGYKGYGLAVLVEILSGATARGSRCPPCSPMRSRRSAARWESPHPGSVDTMGVLGEMFPGPKITDEAGEDGDAQPWRLGPIDLDRGVVQVRRATPPVEEEVSADVRPIQPDPPA